jgi:hypothetical protein
MRIHDNKLSLIAWNFVIFLKKKQALIQPNNINKIL